MWVDLSWPVEDGMPVYPGDRPTNLTQSKWLENDHYVAFSLETGLHAGTHMDTPMHLVAGGTGIDGVPLSRCFAEGILLDARGLGEIQPPRLPEGALAGKAVLLYTGMEAAYGQEAYYRDHPVVSQTLCQLLIHEKIAFLGMDMPSPDRPPFPVHKALLSQGIPIVENMRNLAALIGRFEVAVFPLRLKAEASPVRAAARLLK